MSGVDRTALRALARAALAASDTLGAYTEISAWAQTVDRSALSARAVATPSETSDRDSHDTDLRATTVAVVVKRIADDDIEDVLDQDADAVEAAVLPALRAASRDCVLTRTEIRIDGEGAQRVGTLTMAFTVTYWVDDPV